MPQARRTGSNVIGTTSAASAGERRTHSPRKGGARVITTTSGVSAGPASGRSRTTSAMSLSGLDDGTEGEPSFSAKKKDPLRKRRESDSGPGATPVLDVRLVYISDAVSPSCACTIRVVRVRLLRIGNNAHGYPLWLPIKTAQWIALVDNGFSPNAPYALSYTCRERWMLTQTPLPCFCLLPGPTAWVGQGGVEAVAQRRREERPQETGLAEEAARCCVEEGGGHAFQRRGRKSTDSMEDSVCGPFGPMGRLDQW
jgi:hypothetical protein